MKTHLYQGLLQALQDDLPLRGDHDLHDAAVSLLFASLLKKARDTSDALPTSQLEASAISAFEAAEDFCMVTNRRFRHGCEFESRFDPRVLTVLSHAQRKIYALLHDNLTFTSMFESCGHGPGVTTSVNARKLGVDSKYDESRISVSRTALPVFRVISSGYLWPLARGISAEGPTSLANSEMTIQECDKITFVPKSATSLRSIAVGPTANVYMQLGVGRFLTKRLLRWGVNLSDQTTNSDLARYGSYSGALATLDLKAASDHLSAGLVQWLLPPRMFRVLDSLRSRSYKLGEDVKPYHKFSGMGNGFTFPLQTIVFHSLMTACCDVVGVSNSFTSTYGDDIVIPVQAVELAKSVLNACGFIVNDQKSFVDGPFRESCGGQFFLGQDIRPVYWKGFNGPVTTQQICKLAHQLVLWQYRIADHSPVSLRGTLAFLKGVAWKHAAVSGEQVPSVPINAPVGSGFPLPYSALDEWTGRVYVFTPDKRVARSAAMYCYALDGGLKQVGEDPTWRKTVDARSSGRWQIRRRRLFLGEYS